MSITSALAAAILALLIPTRVSDPPANLRTSPSVEAVARAKDDLTLSFTIGGRIDKVLVKPGDRVEAGQPLLALDDRQAAASLELLRLRADSDLEVQAALAEWDLAKLELEKWKDIHSRAAANDMQLRKAELDAERARLAYELFKQRREEARLTFRQAQAQSREYAILSPGAGIVDELVVEPGETVEPGKPIVRVVSTEFLRIDAPVPTGSTLALRVGGPAWVIADVTNPPTVLGGAITHIASVADASSDTRIVRIEARNDANLPAGIHCTVSFESPRSN